MKQRDSYYCGNMQGSIFKSLRLVLFPFDGVFMRVGLILILSLGSSLALAAIEPLPAYLFGSYKSLPANNGQCLNGFSGNLRVIQDKENCIAFQARNDKGDWEEAIALCDVNKGRKERSEDSSMLVVGKTKIQLTSESKVDSDGSFSADYSNIEKTVAGKKIVNFMTTSIRGSLQGNLLSIDMKIQYEEKASEKKYSCKYTRQVDAISLKTTAAHQKR